MNKGVIYALWDYEPQNDDELPMKEGDCMTIIRREDEEEVEWWWARLNEKEGYVPRNLLGVSIPHWEVLLRVKTGCVKTAVCYGSINKMKTDDMSSKKRGYLQVIYNKYFEDSIQVLYHLNMECLK